MVTLSVFQRGTPDIFNLILLLIGVLLCVLAINTLYEWLRTKPWHNNNHPSENIEGEEQLPPDQPSDKEDRHDSFNSVVFEVTADR